MGESSTIIRVTVASEKSGPPIELSKFHPYGNPHSIFAIFDCTHLKSVMYTTSCACNQSLAQHLVSNPKSAKIEFLMGRRHVFAEEAMW